MATKSETVIRNAFPSIDEEIFSYVTGILEGNEDDFDTVDDVYDAVGEVLHEVAGDFNRTEDINIKSLCKELFEAMKIKSGAGQNMNNGLKKLDKSVDLMDKVKQQESSRLDGGGFWTKENIGGVQNNSNSKKLEKIEARQKEKQSKRINAINDRPPQEITLDEASVSQAFSKKELRQEAKGTNNAKDIRIDNFDLSYKDKVLIKGADVLLSYGRRYGLVGRNGLGKTTLLKAISGSQLRIPSHITVLHVEQEVVGDDTTALESVLQCDEVRERLLKEESELTAKINESGNASDETLSDRLAAVYVQLQHVEADKAPSRASVILFGLGFDAEMQLKATREFSGGWRMRLALARALFSLPDLLLLDEPTNMLDIKAIIWLESYLQAWPSTLLVVSHDRHFLNVVPTDILFLRDHQLEPYRGNYDNFFKAKTEKLKNQIREYEAQQQYRAHAQEFIDKFRYNAKRASLVQSKIKLLEKLPEIKAIEKESDVIFRFPNPEKLSPPIIQLDEVNFSYTPGHKVLTDINLSANMESRICIVGENGAGKSTLLKILTGSLNPVSGIYHCHRNLRIGYFSQHHVDQLDLSVSAVELLANRFPGHPSEFYRQQLGRFGVSGDLALQLVASLSGGQKSRVAFAAMTLKNPNFLVLDEPTNHLDVETIEALGKAITKYEGGVVLVSHDETLIRMVCTELWICAKGSVKSIEGGFDAYRDLVKLELKSQMQKK